MLSRFFMKEENPKPIISEMNQHRCWFEQTQENIYVSFFLSWGRGALFCESILKTSVNGVNQSKRQVAVIFEGTEKTTETVGCFA